MFCEKKFDGFTVFATNLVKCTPVFSVATP